MIIYFSGTGNSLATARKIAKYPRRVNGAPAHYADAYANDQDWALMYWLLVNE